MKSKKNVFLKKWIVIAIFIALSVVSILFMEKVKINYNLADYLGDDTETKIALDIIEDEFGMTGNMQVMVKNVSEATAEEIFDKIKNVNNVLNVNFDKYDEKYYKDGNALYIIVIDGDDYSENAKNVTNDVKSILKTYEGVEYGGTTIEKQELQDSITNEMVFILSVSLSLVIIILLITSESWLEPIVLLFASGVAILLNRGSNFIFGEISYITNSISAILQLALSIDYSIVLLHAYHKEKETNDDCYKAMHLAIMSVIKPVSASALTTIAGLLALLFMSFRIGFDIGIVLMKGIVISGIVSVTLLPALILLLDKLMKKTKKKAFIPNGNLFCKTAFKTCKVIVPIAVMIVITCCFLQRGNTYIFSDTKVGNIVISEEFGNNNSVIVVYKNTEKNFENEKKLIDKVSQYDTKDGNSVLSNYTSYTNTALEYYDIEKAVRKMDISKENAQMLFTMYHLYNAPDSVKISFEEFIKIANDLLDSDEDAKEFVDEDTKDMLKTISLISEIVQNEYTAEELYSKINNGTIKDQEIDLLAIKQIYGMYYYSKLPNKSIDYKSLLNFMLNLSTKDELKEMYDEKTITQLQTLINGINEFESNMQMPFDKTTFKGWYYQNTGSIMTDDQVDNIWEGYYGDNSQEDSTISFLNLMKFLVKAGIITDDKTILEINSYDSIYNAINSKYEYEEFIEITNYIISSLSDQIIEMNITSEFLQQIYIMYFYNDNTMINAKISGKEFAEFTLSKAQQNSIINSALTDESRNVLSDMLMVSAYLDDNAKLNYENMYNLIFKMQTEVKSNLVTKELEKDKISGVYIKYAINNYPNIISSVKACDLVNFVNTHKDTNLLLIHKMTNENRKKINEASDELEKAEQIFVSENYSRMLLSVNLPNESTETTEFVSNLKKDVNSIFGEEAYITGEIVSTYDLEKTFDHDNLFIMIFTIVSILIIVAIIFKSLSLPIILVIIIQGAIYIAMSIQLLGNGIFFMSYIVSTCILMGATIDYGILMSSSYVALRSEYNRKEALSLSVNTAIPTVFTSGFILIICGFVIYFISSQNSISTVGLLIGTGTICSVIMILFVLPSVLYLCDKFVLKLSLKKKNK